MVTSCVISPAACISASARAAASGSHSGSTRATCIVVSVASRLMSSVYCSDSITRVAAAVSAESLQAMLR